VRIKRTIRRIPRKTIRRLIINDFLLSNPDIIRKALEDDLMKASTPKAITTRFDKMKDTYLEGFDAVQRAMIREILDVVKEETPLKKDEDVEPKTNKQ
jgi:hypothetical protein